MRLVPNAGRHRADPPGGLYGTGSRPVDRLTRTGLAVLSVAVAVAAGAGLLGLRHGDDRAGPPAAVPPPLPALSPPVFVSSPSPSAERREQARPRASGTRSAPAARARPKPPRPVPATPVLLGPGSRLPALSAFCLASAGLTAVALPGPGGWTCTGLLTRPRAIDPDAACRFQYGDAARADGDELTWRCFRAGR